MKMNIPLMATLLGLSLVVCPLMYIYVGPALDATQLSTLKTLGAICACSAIYCFVVGELTGNNSQMDKLWSLLPIAYTWIIAINGGMQLRLVVIAILATLWGCRLTMNFARKGAYKLKFWEGEEDYRWSVVRNGAPFKGNRLAWGLFDLLFISIYQNVLVLMTTFPALVSMNSTVPFGWVDVLAAALMFYFIAHETIADEQQWAFQTTKWKMIKAGQKLEDLPAPYNKGFNTHGLWSHSRHPNYRTGYLVRPVYLLHRRRCGRFQLEHHWRAAADCTLPRQLRPGRGNQFRQIPGIRQILPGRSFLFCLD